MSEQHHPSTSSQQQQPAVSMGDQSIPSELAVNGGIQQASSSSTGKKPASNRGLPGTSSAPINGIRTDVDPNKEYRVSAKEGQTGRQLDISYTNLKAVGNGSFGVVFQAKIVETGELTAIKKVLQDKRFKNRELQIMRAVNHPNIVTLRYYFYTHGEKGDDIFLNLVLEYVPETVYKACRHYARLKQPMPPLQIKIYMYQLFRSLAYIHSMGICHRDIKPQNLLLDPGSGVLKLCDFGSAKALVPGEPNVSYICSRYYRAPELIFGATSYTPAIDVWSSGCVMAEMMLGTPLFPGESGVDQLVEIIKVLGTPSREQIKAMNPNYTEFRFPAIKAHPWSKVFRSRSTTEAQEFISKLLDYTPTMRLSAIEALAHPFFDELRLSTTTLPNGASLPVLFNFSAQELSIRPDLITRLVPEWYAPELKQTTGVDIYNFQPVVIGNKLAND